MSDDSKDSANPVLDSRAMNKFSRQIAALGAEATAKLSKMKILIVGMQGLGIETAKNLALQGAGSITLIDNTPTRIQDVGLNFFLTEGDVDKPRASCVLPRLQELNPICRMTVEENLTNNLIDSYSALVITTPMGKSELIKLNEYCRQKGVSFFYGASLGVYGSLFVDHGPNHFVSDKDGEKPIQKLITEIIPCADNTMETLIRYDTPEGQMPTGINDGFFLVSEVDSIPDINKVFEVRRKESDPVRTIRVPYQWKAEDTYVVGGLLTEEKTPVAYPMRSLSEKITELGSAYDVPATAVSTDLTNFSEQSQHVSFVAIHTFFDRHQKMPAVSSEDDAKEIVAIAKELIESKEINFEGFEVDETFVSRYANFSGNELQPMSAFLGGVLAQEVVKCTGKLTPIPGFLHFGAREVLPSEAPSAEDCAPRNSRLDNLAAVFGWKFVEKLGNLKYFMVGCGALGCEFLKNFALNGICCGPDGKLVVTDPDRIELSNLSRQFLFREHNVGQPKSRAGSAMAVTMNKDFKVEALELLVGPKSEDYLNDEFWERQDGICNALDNMEARFYVDAQCVKYEKSLLESGTMGTGGNVDAIIPFKTGTYRDGGKAADGAGVPMCTLRNFPHITDHCIEWARDQFEFLFVKLAKICENYLGNPSAIEHDISSKPDASGAIFEARSLISFLRAASQPSIGSCVRLANDIFHYFFRDRILDLQATFPRDYRMIENGVDRGPFWGEKRRYPTAAVLDLNDEAHVQFMISSTCLFAVVLGIIPPKTENDDTWCENFRQKDWIVNVLKDMEPPVYIQTPVSTAGMDNVKTEGALDIHGILNGLFKELREVAASVTPSPYELADFEKDDDLNFHVGFMTATANLRCDNYTIKRTDFHSCKVIAGRIIPALATTTTAVCGLVMFELFKIVQNKDTDDYRNHNIGLAGNAYSSFSPDPPKQHKTRVENEIPDSTTLDESCFDEKGQVKEEYVTKVVKRTYPEKHTVWDKITCSGSLTLSQFSKWLETEHKLKMVKWDFVIGMKAQIPKSAPIFPPKPMLDVTLLPSMDLSVAQATAALMRNPACRSNLQQYVKLWKDWKDNGGQPVASNTPVITENNTLREILEMMSDMATSAEEKKEVDVKLISTVSDRKFWIIPGSEAPVCTDIESGDEVDTICAIKINLRE